MIGYKMGVDFFLELACIKAPEMFISGAKKKGKEVCVTETISAKRPKTFNHNPADFCGGSKKRFGSGLE